MVDTVRAISWEAPEHHHIEKTSDWFWAVSIIGIAAAVASVIFDNVLFAMVILLGASTMILFAHRMPKMLSFEVSVRGVRISNTLYPFGTLESFCIDEENFTGPQLILKSKHLFVPLIILPIPENYIDEIEHIVAPRLLEEHIEEPFAHRLLEFFGF